MRLIVARCEVRYSGGLNAVLPEALRLLMVKADGSVMVHADTGGYSSNSSCAMVSSSTASGSSASNSPTSA
jgi:RecB family endonuclease NucS